MHQEKIFELFKFSQEDSKYKKYNFMLLICILFLKNETF